jgi:hypothetical protein
MKTAPSAPSTNNLMTKLNIDETRAKLIRAVIKNDTITTKAFKLNQYERMYKTYQRKLICIDKIIGGFGVEVIGDCNSCIDSDIKAEYVNLGDTYTSTILYNRKTGTYQLTTFGDFVERNRL